MLTIIITCDEQDSELGHYFAQSKQYLESFLTEQQIDFNCLSTSQCHQAHIDFLIERVPKPLVFISYSHGNPNSLRCNGAAYLATDNVAPLYTSLVYAMSCLAASKLGVTFAQKEGVFIGFDKEIKAFRSGEHLDMCVRCDNSGIIFALCHPNNTLKDAYKAMKVHYNNVIDRLDTLKEQGLYVGYFRNMRDSLKIIGNTNLSINELFTNTQI